MAIEGPSRPFDSERSSRTRERGVDRPSARRAPHAHQPWRAEGAANSDVVSPSGCSGARSCNLHDSHARERGRLHVQIARPGAATRWPQFWRAGADGCAERATPRDGPGVHRSVRLLRSLSKGLDGPSIAIAPYKKYCTVFVSPPGCLLRQGGWGLGRRRTAAFEGMPACGNGAGRGPRAPRGQKLTERPRIPAVQAGIRRPVRRRNNPRPPWRSRGPGTREAHLKPACS